MLYADVFMKIMIFEKLKATRTSILQILMNSYIHRFTQYFQSSIPKGKIFAISLRKHFSKVSDKIHLLTRLISKCSSFKYL